MGLGLTFWNLQNRNTACANPKLCDPLHEILLIHVTFLMWSTAYPIFFCEAVTNIFCYQHTFILSLSVHGLSVIDTTERVLLKCWQLQLVFLRHPGRILVGTLDCPNGDSSFTFYLLMYICK